ncbi:MAG: hypothetical protein IKV03_03145 [Alphaproteobacteria bacterium]|nr:hypothetical protein [Alphaproteobacteria bacterium]
MTFKIETGRSMTEMLGTLAIIGVLSVTAITGYSYGMDKYRANKTVNDIMLMGIDMITQISRFDRIPNLSEWGEKTSVGYDFKVEPSPSDTTKYGIVIEGVPSRVCSMVGDALKTQASVYVGNVDYGSANTDPCEASNDNTMEFYFETSSNANDTPECQTDTDCGEGRYCDIDTRICFRGDKPIGTYSPALCSIDNDCGICGGSCYYGMCDVSSKNGINCSTDTITNGICHYGECIPKEGCTYDKNKCKETEYCASPNSSCTEAFPDNETGTCQTPDYVKYDIDGKTYYISYYRISWWDADASCKALGKKLGKTMGLISVDELLTGWSGGNGYYARTELAKKLYEKGWNNSGYPRIWTSDSYNSCQAHFVSLDASFSEKSQLDVYIRYASARVYGDSPYSICR